MKTKFIVSRKSLTRSEQRNIRGGRRYPRNERECYHCGGEWDVFVCALPEGSPCSGDSL